MGGRGQEVNLEGGSARVEGKLTSSLCISYKCIFIPFFDKTHPFLCLAVESSLKSIHEHDHPEGAAERT